jgi:hypothetical protein
VAVDSFRVRIDPKKSGNTDKVTRFDFQGNHRTAGLHIRRAVAEYLDDRMSITNRQPSFRLREKRHGNTKDF